MKNSESISANEHFNVTIIDRQSVIDIATSIDQTLTDEEILWVILSYEDAQRQDPTGTWNLVVEDLIYQIPRIVFDDSEERRDFGNDPEDMDDHPFPFHTDGDGDDDTLLNFMG